MMFQAQNLDAQKQTKQAFEALDDAQRRVIVEEMNLTGVEGQRCAGPIAFYIHKAGSAHDWSHALSRPQVRRRRWKTGWPCLPHLLLASGT